MATGIFQHARAWLAKGSRSRSSVRCWLGPRTGLMQAAGAAGTPEATLRAAARLATGDPAGAAVALPGVGHAALLASYTHAFDRLLIGLAVVTVQCGVVFAFLRATGGD